MDTTDDLHATTECVCGTEEQSNKKLVEKVNITFMVLVLQRMMSIKPVLTRCSFAKEEKNNSGQLVLFFHVKSIRLKVTGLRSAEPLTFCRLPGNHDMFFFLMKEYTHIFYFYIYIFVKKIDI